MAAVKQVKSKKRVVDYGEVFTAEREVKAMCDMVGNDCERYDSRVLEPACGTGNFLSEILKRKLANVSADYKRSVFDWERYSLLAVGSLYGVDILEDNCRECRDRLYNIWDAAYRSLFKKRDLSEVVCKAIRFVLERNIICGDALSLTEVDTHQRPTGKPIIFSEWSCPKNDAFIHRKDYTMSELLVGDLEENKAKLSKTLFSATQEGNLCEDGSRFIKEYIHHYRRIGEEELGQ